MAPVASGSESKRWEEWYRLARYALACSHAEAVQYANLRFVEEQNRQRRPRVRISGLQLDRAFEGDSRE
jgi:hypothetical protein